MTGALRRISVAALIFTMLFSYIPGDQMEVRAAAAIGRLNDTYYEDFDDLRSDLEDDYKNRSVTIEMLTNWDANENSDYDERLIIPGGCKATLNMNGWVFDRDNTASNDWSYNGELICVESGATLTVNGGPKTRHDEPVYSSTSRDGKADKVKSFYGGVLTGGASTGGAGGIHVKSSCTVTLNDVTIAGCRAEAPWYDMAGTNSAYGGGIWLKGGSSNLRMNNSTITGCFAYYDGGGIFQSNHNNVNIEVNDSHIDENYAAGEGGGIDTDGEYVYVIGDGDSTISNNEAITAGGGAYLWNDDTTLSGFIMEGNKSRNGAAVYTEESSVTLSGLVIKNNTASERGGGIYINNDGNTVSSCEITGNGAGISGDGVYVNSDVDAGFTVSGKTIIKGNNRDDLYISDNEPEDTRVNFSLTKGSDVRMNYYNTAGKDAIAVSPSDEAIKSSNCIQYLKAGNQGYHFTFNAKPNSRKIFYVKDGKDNEELYGESVPEPAEPTRITAEQAEPKVVGKVRAGGEKDQNGEYDLIRGFFRHEKYDSGTEDTDAVFYYSDAFFDADPAVYNDHLATASWVLTLAGTYLRKSEEADENGNIYYNKHAGARQFLADIGCPDDNIYVNENNIRKPGTDTIGVTIGSKKLKKADGTETGYTLVPVTVRGGGYEAEWASNVTLGTARETLDEGKEARGFSSAATQVMESIDEYIEKYELEDELADGKVVFWVSGFSRAGATANITSKRLVEKYASGADGKNNKVFGYPCEAPKGGTNDAQQLDPEKYYCIHNLINAADLVPLVGPEQMGFKRYGVDHYIPGSPYQGIRSGSKNADCGGQDGPGAVTTYWDNVYQGYWQSNNLDGNEPGSVEANETHRHKMDGQRTAMYDQLKTIDSGMIYDCYFHPMTMGFIPPSMSEAGYYKGNHVETFLRDFVRFLQEGDIDNSWTKTIESRDEWAGYYQPVMRDVMALLFGMSDTASAGFINRAQTIINNISYVGGEVSMWELYRNVVGEWHDLSEADKNKYTTFLWKKLKESDAFDFISETDQSKLEKHWPVLMDMIFRMIDGDYNYKPGTVGSSGWAQGSDNNMMYLSTFATYSSYILQNHAPEINMAWARTYDSYYDDETTEYEVYADEAPDAPEAAAVDTAGETVQLEAGEDKVNKLTGDQKIRLSVDSVNGEAIYYDLELRSQDGSAVKNALYSNGIDLATAPSVQKYKVTAYAMYYGARSEKAVYNIDLYGDVHNVMLNTRNSSGEDETLTLVYKEGSEVALSAMQPDDYFFRDWTVYLLDADGVQMEQTIENELLGEDGKADVTAKFTMPQAGDGIGSGSQKYPDGYALKVTANYGDRIRKVTASPSAPEVPEEEGAPAVPLADKVEVAFDNGAEAGEYPVSWTYTYEKDGVTYTVPASGTAYESTEYTATINIDKDEASDILFASSVTGETATGKTIRVTRSAEGNAVVKITFEKTAASDSHKRPDVDVPLTVRAIDLNRPADDQYDPDTDPVEYMVLQESKIMIQAPEVEGEEFSHWDIENAEGVTLTDGSRATDKAITVMTGSTEGFTGFKIDACFIPVVKKIEAVVDTPVGGEALDEEKTLYITISNTYKINPDYYTVTWTPEPLPAGDGRKADYLTPYTATVKLTPVDGKIKATPVDPENDYQEIGEEGETSGYFKYSESLVATINGQAAAQNKAGNSMSYIFPATKYNLRSVLMPEGITGMKNGTPDQEILNSLPQTVKITTDNGKLLDAAVSWTLEQADTPSDPRESAVRKAKGTIQLPDTVENRNEIPEELEIIVRVDEADHIASPSATLPSGSFLYDQTTQITSAADDGCTTYYTVDGSDPLSESSGRRKYNSGDVIEITREDAEHPGGDTSRPKRIVLKIATVSDDGSRWDSSVATYLYEFTDEVDIPKGNILTYSGKEQTGIEGGEFYTLEVEEGSGATIDKNGSAAAVSAGTYEVTAKVKEGFRWKTEDGGASEEDQKITFTVNKADIANARLSEIESCVFNGSAHRPALTILFNETNLSENADYTAEYSNNVNVGTASVVIRGTGNFEGTLEGTFEIVKGIITVTADDKSKIAGDIDPELTWTVSGTTDVDAAGMLGVVISRELGEAVGTYKILISGNDVYSGYAVKYVNGTFTITEPGPSDRTWKISFDAGGGSGEMKEVYILKGNKYELPECGFTAPDGKDFEGWTVTETGKEAAEDAPVYLPGDQADITSDSTVKAVWKDKDATPDRSKQRGKDGTWFGKGASLEAAEAALARLTTDKDPKGTKFAPLRVKSTRQTKKSIKLTWKKASGAKKYIIYSNRCGKGRKYKKLVTLSSGKRAYNVKKSAGKKLRKATYYKFIIIAVDKNNDVVTTSKVKHVSTAGSRKKANYRKVVVKAKVTKTGKRLKKYRATSAIRLKKGKTALLRTLLKKAKKTKVMKHVGARYESSNVKIAKVTSKGKVKAIKKGTCKIYVFAQNGIAKTVKVTVK